VPLFIHQSGEIVRAVPDNPDRAFTEARRLAASTEWRDLTEDQLADIREGADPLEVYAQCPPTEPPAPRPRKVAKAAPRRQTEEV
jgi:hypothetical protein